MLTREELLETVNELNSRYAGSKVGFINGYRDQWFLGGYFYSNELQNRQELRLHFCQGRRLGRIHSSRGYSMILDVTTCNNREEVFREFELLDHHKRREKEREETLRQRLEARCPHCVHYLGRITGNCTPSAACAYKRIRKRKEAKKMQRQMAEALCL